MIDYRVTEIKI